MRSGIFWHQVGGKEKKRPMRRREREVFFSFPSSSFPLLFAQLPPGEKGEKCAQEKKWEVRGCGTRKKKKEIVCFCSLSLFACSFWRKLTSTTPSPHSKDQRPYSPHPPPPASIQTLVVFWAAAIANGEGGKIFCVSIPSFPTLEDEIAASEFVLVFPGGKKRRRRTEQQHQKISSPSKERRE